MNKRMNRTELVGCLGLVIAIFVVAWLASTTLVYVFWAWIVPDVFAGAVEQGLMPSHLTLWQSAKIAWVVAIFFSSKSSSSQAS